MSDLYQALELERTATTAQLKKAYRKLAAQYHPDKHANSVEANERFQKISFAYEVLSDPERRQWYDKYGEESLERGFDPEFARERPRSSRQNAASSNPFDSIFQSVVDMFGQVQTLPVPFLEALRGGVVTLPSGAELGRIPPGTQSGDRLTFANPRGASAPPIHMQVTVQPHHIFSRMGANLLMELRVTLLELYRGEPIHFEGPWSNLEVRLPPGSWQGDRIRMSGHGVRLPRASPGDLLANLHVELPPGDEGLAAALERLQGGYNPRTKPK